LNILLFKGQSETSSNKFKDDKTGLITYLMTSRKKKR